MQRLNDVKIYDDRLNVSLISEKKIHIPRNVAVQIPAK